MEDNAKNLEMWLADEPYLPDLAEEDYSAVNVTMPKGGIRNVDVTEGVFKQKVDEAFRKRMGKILSPAQIEECIDSPIYNKCVTNKFKEVQMDNDNTNLSQEKVLRGHIASLMHCLFLIYS